MEKNIITEINKHFLIKIDGLEYKNMLIGAGQYHKYIENENLANKHFSEVLKNGLYKTTKKLRRGITVIFYSK